jgi:REP element-mobilizing transposase RayT
MVKKTVYFLNVGKFNDDIQQIIHDYCTNRDVKIKAIQSDIDHLNILIDCDTNIEPHNFKSYMKQNTTYHIWKLQKVVLEMHFWK